MKLVFFSLVLFCRFMQSILEASCSIQNSWVSFSTYKRAERNVNKSIDETNLHTHTQPHGQRKRMRRKRHEKNIPKDTHKTCVSCVCASVYMNNNNNITEICKELCLLCELMLAYNAHTIAVVLSLSRSLISWHFCYSSVA